MLLTGAGLLMRSFLRLRAVDTGFRTENLLTMETFLPPARYPKAEHQRAFFQQVIRQLEAVPGVQSVGASIGLPFTDASIFFSFNLDGQSSPSDGKLIASYRAISPNYFRTMGIQLIAGRDFSEQDQVQAPGVVIVNRSFARRYFQGEDPLGKQIDIGDGYNKPREIVGVVADAKSKTLTTSAAPEMYVIYLQRPWPWLRYAVRSSIAPDALTSAVRKVVWSVDKDIAVTEVKTMNRLIAQSITEPRFYFVLLSLFAVIALLLAALGIYGVMAYGVKERTQEIGIRMAIGAQRTAVLLLVVKQGMKLAFCGVVLGWFAALAATRVLTKLLFGVSTADPATFAGMSLLLAVVALLACYLPARRATKIDPIIALRYE
jgi:putative ABC transport system permease protein